MNGEGAPLKGAPTDGLPATSSVAQAALAAHRAGLNVLPPREDGSKAPDAREWKTRQKRFTTEAEIMAMYANGRTGLGVVTGAISGGLALFEFEGRAISAGLLVDFVGAAKACGLGDLVERIAAGYTDKSPSGGLHWLFRCPEPKSTVLARTPEGPPLIETKGEAGFCITAPSHGMVHPTGRSWDLVTGGFATIATLTAEERDELHRLAATFDQRPRPKVIEPKPTRNQDRDRTEGELLPGDDLNARATWAEILEPHGWVFLFTASDGNQHWRRPGKAIGTSATISEAGDGVLFVFTSSTEFEPHTSFSKFGAYAVQNHNGDHSEAARALYAEGYGTRHDRDHHVDGDRDHLVDGGEDGVAGIQEEWDAPAPDEDDLEVTTWRPVDLTNALAGADIPAPTLFKRTDGHHLLYRGRVHWFVGASESLKSWAAQRVTADVINEGGDVLYLDFEDDENGVVARLRAQGVTVDAIAAHLVYLRPDEALANRFGVPTPAAGDFADVLRARTYSLAIIDGVTEAMTTEGLELTDNADVARWLRMLPKRISALGPAVVVVDHVPKAAEAQGRYAIGGQHKLAGVTGASYNFTTMRPLSRALGSEPVEGTVAITVSKDRPGHVRGFAFEGKVGTLVVTSWPDGAVDVELVPPGDDMPDMRLVRRLVEYLDLYDGSSKNAIESGVEGKAAGIRGALAWMALNGHVRIEQKGQSHLHWLTDTGREVVK